MQSFTLLIVDDVPTNISVLLDSLSKDFRILVAENGESCLEQMPHAKPDLILLDVKMPGMDGFEVIKKLKAHSDWNSIPVIFMTALDEPEEKSKAIEMGAVDYVTKPIYVPEVLARIQTHLDIVALRRELEERNKQLEVEVLMRRETEEQLRSSMVTAFIVASLDGQVVFSTQLANTLCLQYFESSGEVMLPEKLLENWRANKNRARASRWSFSHPKRNASLNVELFQGTDDARVVLFRMEEDGKINPLALTPLGLSPRETEVLFWISEGKSNGEVATILSASIRTIHKHVENIFRKLKVENRASAIRLALETFQRTG